MRADSWILKDLPELIIRDWYDGHVYTESDMQASVYYWLRKHFEKERNAEWFIRTEPVLRTPSGIRKPDIVVYRNSTPFDFIELKCQLDGFSSDALVADLDKLRDLKPVFNVRHAYQFVLYDEADSMKLRTRQEWMRRYVTFVGANVRRRPGNARQRPGYHEARRHWEKWRDAKPASVIPG
jgi:hypothetical protein